MSTCSLVDGNIWIQDDDTEDDIATDWVAGVPKEDIVLGFRHPKVRQHTGFAIA
ncbi:MAG: XisI protein [Merismopedia sp. SIO2A8]|nr:XisI protein [Symploca sp. SIO2B6]NET50327.1 XisI protein [Merismopedia sp. SIO2A8]